MKIETKTDKQIDGDIQNSQREREKYIYIERMCGNVSCRTAYTSRQGDGKKTVIGQEKKIYISVRE